jgi:CBS domain-containing protein
MSELTPRERSLAAQAFRHLVTRSGTKIALTVSDLSEFDLPLSELQAVVDKLAAPEIRILRRVEATTGENAEERFEIFHDVLAAAVLDWRARFLAFRDRPRVKRRKLQFAGSFRSPVADALAHGEIVPVLGFGVALADRPDDLLWKPGVAYPPSGSELARHLHARFDLPPEIPLDLRQVAQFVALEIGHGRLYNELRAIYDVYKDPYPASAHRLFAALPQMLRDVGGNPALLIVTTAFDGMLERAFHERNESFDVVRYLAAGEHAGRFSWSSPDGSWSVLDDPDGQGYELLASRPVILRLSGGVDVDRGRDSFVITEDDVIDYLTRGSLAARLPSVMLETLGNSHFLFLGLSLRDWTQRALVGSLLGRADLPLKSWAVQWSPDRVDEAFWRRQAVWVVDAPLGEYVAALARDIGLEREIGLE